jgi:ABC-2 type transport system ATP-binding protein
MAQTLAVAELVKRYGPRFAVRGVSFAIEEGEVVGLLGPNGSGKSTILRILAGYLPPSAGAVHVAGADLAADPLAVRRRVGYVPEDAPLYDGLRVGEFLRFMAAIKGLDGTARRVAIAAAVERLDLGPVVTMPIGKLSRGYRQRVAIAQALLGDPPVLLLDEPTNALDAYQVIGVRELVRSLAGRRTVLLASHVLAEIERLAGRVMILRDGRLLTSDAMAEAGSTRQARLRIAGPADAVLTALKEAPGVAAAVREAIDEPATYVVDFAAGWPDPAGLAQAVVSRGFALLELTETKPDLERIFLDLTRRASTQQALAA